MQEVLLTKEKHEWELRMQKQASMKAFSELDKNLNERQKRIRKLFAW